MKSAVLVLVATFLVLSTFLLVVAPIPAASDRGDCRAANGGVHGTTLASYVQTYGGVARGPEACGSLVPPL